MQDTRGGNLRIMFHAVSLKKTIKRSVWDAEERIRSGPIKSRQYALNISLREV
jgi:hypothetical protein